MTKPKVASQTLTPSAIRNRLLRRIHEATFPRDATAFTLAELCQTGLADNYSQPAELPDSHFKLLVLLATQNKELRRQRDKLLRENEAQEDYFSPIRDQLRYEPDPLKQQELTRQAEADEARVEQIRTERKRAQLSEFERFVAAASRKRWANRDRRQQPRRAVFWHETMTVMDYHEATGLTRRTLQNLLRRIKADPILKRQRRNEPARYGPANNFAVLREWLLRYEKQPEHRRAWLVRTLLKYAHEMPDHLNTVAHAVHPVLESLGINDTPKFEAFLKYYRQCEAIIYPPGAQTLASLPHLIG